jgi:hypothetical protein
MTTVTKPSYVRCASSLQEIEDEIKQLKINYESIYENAKIMIEINPNPKNVCYDGSTKEFNLLAKITYID